MDAVWSRDADTATVRDILAVVNARESRPLAYTTIMTIMARLHRKGILDRELDHRTNVYQARFSREQYMEARAAAQVQALVDEFGDTAVTLKSPAAPAPAPRRDGFARVAGLSSDITPVADHYVVDIDDQRFRLTRDRACRNTTMRRSTLWWPTVPT